MLVTFHCVKCDATSYSSRLPPPIHVRAHKLYPPEKVPIGQACETTSIEKKLPNTPHFADPCVSREYGLDVARSPIFRAKNAYFPVQRTQAGLDAWGRRGNK